MIEYDEFIKNKALVIQSVGINVDTAELNPELFDFQKDIVRWALAKGKAAIFADCGLGKTLMQLEWAEQIRKRGNRDETSHEALYYYNRELSDCNSVIWFEHSGDVEFLFEHTETDWGIEYTTRFFK